ncbi:MAG: class II aldolase/adducin family protein [Acidimicrobiia bacterium]|nr:class II aldolase/adducin family protein [Acidimicrobiia bacterium]
MSGVEKPRRLMAPPLPSMTPQASVALLARMLFREGYDDHLAGHITARQPDGTLLVNPWGLTWDEVTASDIMRIDGDGHVLEGRWTVTPAITLHIELHRQRPDIGVALHNHPRWGTLWADAHRVPPVYDQTSAMMPGDPALYDDFGGSVDALDNARACVAALGDASTALLANHGVLVVGEDMAQAHHRAVVLEWRCRQAWHVEAMGGGVPVRPEVFERFAAPFAQVSFPGLFEAMARRELRADPSILQ